MADAFAKGDVVWAADPFRSGSDPRLWVVLVAEYLPFPGEEYLCAALTTSDLPENVEVGDGWMRGRHPERTSFCSPWVLGTIKHDAIDHPQGQLTEPFTDRIIERTTAYFYPTGDVPRPGP